MYALTNSDSISLGLLIPLVTAFFVISLNTTLSTFFPFKSFLLSRISLTCHAIASPSLSGSVAKIILLESAAASVISLTYFFEKRI